jgi:arsenical pump membrane protein
VPGLEVPVGLAVALALLAATLAVATLRPAGIPEAALAVPAAAACAAGGLLTLDAARAEARALAPTLAFLAAVLVLARLCAVEGVFSWVGGVMARAARGRPVTLLGWVLGVAFAVTTVLSLDATVVLFTPVVLATAAAAGIAARPHVFVTAHLANSASLLLPISNLTNLLAFSAAGLGFERFALLMALPTLAVLVVEYVAARLFFAAELSAGPSVAGGGGAEEPQAPPWFALAVVAGTLAGLGASSALNVAPGVVAGIGAGVLAARRLLARTTSPVDLVRWTDPLFLLFVLALALVVRAVDDQGLGDVVRPLVRHGADLPGLLATAAVAAVLANCVNNLPAILLLVPQVSAGGPGPVLAALIGVNVGPNLTYVGSLATMLWRRVLNRAGLRVSVGEFTRYGLVSAPAALVAACGALWLGLRVFGP